MKLTIDIPNKRIADLLCSALEGGINYWGQIVEYHKPERLDFKFDDERVYRHIDYPMNPGGGTNGHNVYITVCKED